MLNKKQFMDAIEIISLHHTTKLSLNLPEDDFVGGIGYTKFNIYITQCCPTVINNLKNEGFMLRMSGKKGLEVDKI